jgi:Right handed beta helix region
MQSHRIDRRLFLGSSSAVAVAWACRPARAEDPPQVINPRATSGDQRFEPDWKEQLTLTVGPGTADISGNTDKAIQAAVDYVARLGGGSVKILPGVFKCRNSIFLPSGIRIVGSGLDSVIEKEASVATRLVEDSDWYDQEITLADAQGFQLGDGVFLTKTHTIDGGPVNLKRTLVARNGNRFKLDRPLRKNLWLKAEPTCASLFPLFSGESINDIVIENLTFDGNRANNDNLNGNHGGCIWLQDCNRVALRGLTLRRFNGDGISWQVCHDVVVEHCHSHDHADLGLHPGSGSQRPLIRDNTLERNGIGIFWCWGVKFGLAENNRIVDNRNYGISIGHNDTDNVMRGNEVIGSGKVGVLFRDDSRGNNFWPNRNVLENNRIVDSGADEGIAIDIQGKTSEITIVRNEIRETRESARRVGIRLGVGTSNIKNVDNVITGFATAIRDLQD